MLLNNMNIHLIGARICAICIMVVIHSAVLCSMPLPTDNSTINAVVKELYITGRQESID